MRYYFILSALFLLVINLVSCEQSHEAKIKAAFESYIQKNFDDPSSFVEVVSIDTNDTISTKQLKNLYRTLFERSDSLSKLKNRLNDTILLYTYKNMQRLRTNNDFIEALSNYRDALQHVTDFSKMMMDPRLTKDCLVPDQFDEMRDTLIYSSIIKYRVKKSGNLKLESIEVYYDSDCKNISFGNQKEKSDYLKSFYKSYTKSCDFVMKQCDLEQDVLLKGDNLLDIILSNNK